MTSAEYHDAALRLFPGGSNGEYHLPPELVPVLERGSGCRVWDVAGREFLDYTMAWGSCLVGHAHPRVVEAATRQAALGTNFAHVNRRAVELAERLVDLSPCAEKVRFVASGSEATLLALRIAHGATGRPKILKFEGAYHGQHAVGVTSMLNGRPAVLPQSDPSGSGAAWAAHDILVAPYNDLIRTRQILDAHARELAAVIVEPVHRCIPPLPGFLEGLRAATLHHGIVLVFDEVVTGFRLARGGAQDYFHVRPDLVAYGKALGGGFPIGAVAGPGDLMDVVAEERCPGPRYTWSASTTGGNPVSCAAALAVLDILSEPGVYPALHALGEKFRALLRSQLDAAATPGQILGLGPLAQFAFSAVPVIDQATWLAADRRRSRAMMLELVRRGVFLNPMGTKLYLSLAHDDEALLGFADRFGDALRATSPAG